MAKAKTTTKKADAEGGDKKQRIYEVAREFNLSSVAMVEVIKGLGFEIKNHMAVCTPEMLHSIQSKFEEERNASRQEIKRKAEQKQQRDEAEVEEKKAAKKAELAKKTKAKVQPTEEIVEIKDTDQSGRRKRRQRPTGRSEAAPVVVDSGKPADGAPAKAGAKAPSPEKPDSKKRRRRRGRPQVDQREVEESVRRTMAQMETGSTRTRRRRRREDEDGEEEEETRKIKVNEFTTVGELSSLMEEPATEVIKQCLLMGMMVTINQRLDMDTISLVADEFNVEVEELEEYAEEILEESEADDPADLRPRPPVVTIMGHVDHGKTSLLDHIRNTNVVAGEAGGITQHIGAYHVELDGGKMVTFLDTPGHEAFTAMRARGAQVTDVVVLVVAADDNVMPQTIEAIDHARAASVPVVLALNKMDLPGADVDRIKRQLTDHNILVEDYGGQVQACELSALTGQNVHGLLELLALETDILELKANPDKRAKGTIVEARLDRGRGNVATVLVQEGTLRVGDPFVTGLYSGRVRAMLDERSNPVKEAGPSMPVQVLGLAGLPTAGDSFYSVESERQARDISQKRQQLRREQDFHRGKRVSLVDIHEQIQAGQVQELRLILKGDVDGSVEALHDSLMQIVSDEVRTNVIHRGVGAISESDVLLASASNAIILGFNIRPDARAREVASNEKVDIRLYRVIYEAVEDVKAALSGLLKPAIDEEVSGSAEVREVFTVPRAGTIAGCYMTGGSINRNSMVRVLRDNVVVYQGEVGSLRRFKDDVREVQSGFECGIGVANFNDVKAGDVIEAYILVETARTL
jgi:translation initiation factor IF-2